MKLVDLFCGSGGFSLGAHHAGFEVAAAFDIDPILTSSFSRNFPNTKLHLADVSKLTGEEVKWAAGGEVGGLFGGPPCQGFSDIGRRDVNDERRKLLGHFFRLVKEVRPAFFIMENVPGLAYQDARSELDDAINIVADAYELVGPHVWDAAQFGAPTKRRRIFVVGYDRERCDRLTLEDIAALKQAPASVADAIIDLKDARQVDDVDGFDTWKITRKGQPRCYARTLRTRNGLFTGHKATIHTQKVIDRFALVPHPFPQVSSSRTFLAYGSRSG